MRPEEVDLHDAVRVFAVAREALRAWFRAHARVLPWRKKSQGESTRLNALVASRRSPYSVWISEIMLQQTQVAAVTSHFERWMRLFPDVGTLAAAAEEDVLRAWTGLGYYARARNIHKTAKRLVQGGDWPVRAADWKAFPGIGDYTAGAIASLAFDQPDPILDGNVTRVFSRVVGMAFLPGDGAKQRKVYWDLARMWADSGAPGEINEALMELGAMVCVPGTPRCLQCPLASCCRAYQEEWVDALPPPKRRKPTVGVPAVAVRARRNGRLLLEVRPPGVFLAGHLMFPFFHGEEECARWRKDFNARFAGWKLASVRKAGTARHTVMSNRYEVEIYDAELLPGRTGGTRALPGKRVAAVNVEMSLTSSLALKIWRAGNTV